MARTLNDILTDANAYLSLDATSPSSNDLSTWTNYANQAVLDAADLTPLPEFHEIYQVLATCASIPLPANFREFMTAPRVDFGGGIFDEYPEIRPLERFTKDPQDKYCYVLGNSASGYTAVFNNITSNATLSIDFQRYPSLMATLTDKCELSDDQYVVAKVKSYVLQARTDDRFPIVEAEANRRLQALVGRKSRTPQGGFNTTPHTQRFRIGE